MEQSILQLRNYLDERLTQQDSMIERLYVFMVGEFARYDKRLIAIDNRFDGIYVQLDTIRGLLDTDELERGAQSMQIDRHETQLQTHNAWLERLQKRRAEPRRLS